MYREIAIARDDELARRQGAIAPCDTNVRSQLHRYRTRRYRRPGFTIAIIQINRKKD